jgi:hypothetical protein
MRRLETVDPVIPISNVISRYEKVMEHTRQALMKTPWWKFKRRWVYSGVISAYQFEIDVLLQLAATTQPVLRDLGRIKS